MNRRGFLKSILASGVAPYVVTTAGVLMPVRTLVVPSYEVLKIRFVADIAEFLRKSAYIEDIIKRDLGAIMARDADLALDLPIVRPYLHNPRIRVIFLPTT